MSVAPRIVQDSEQQLEELRLQYRESQKSLGKHTDGLTVRVCMCVWGGGGACLVC